MSLRILKYMYYMYFPIVGKDMKSSTPSSTSSNFVATPLPLQSQTPPTSVTDVNSDGAEQISGAATVRSTQRKRKAVSFADPPTNTDSQNDVDDVIIISPDLPPQPSPPSLSARSSSELTTRTEQKQPDSPSPSLSQAEDKSIEPAKKSTVTTKDGEASFTPLGVVETSDGPSPLTVFRDIHSDEESVASSVSSLTSDTSSLSERPTRRRRGRGRRGRGKKALSQELKTKQGNADNVVGELLKKSGRGRGRRRGRGGRTAPVLTRAAPMETVEDSMEAKGS